jgi:hypothetical protein
MADGRLDAGYNYGRGPFSRSLFLSLSRFHDHHIKQPTHAPHTTIILSKSIKKFGTSTVIWQTKMVQFPNRQIFFMPWLILTPFLRTVKIVPVSAT